MSISYRRPTGGSNPSEVAGRRAAFFDLIYYALVQRAYVVRGYSRVATITLRFPHERTFQRKGRNRHGGRVGHRSRGRRTLLQGRRVGLRRRSQSGDAGETAASYRTLAAA